MLAKPCQQRALERHRRRQGFSASLAPWFVWEDLQWLILWLAWFLQHPAPECTRLYSLCCRTYYCLVDSFSMHFLVPLFFMRHHKVWHFLVSDFPQYPRNSSGMVPQKTFLLFSKPWLFNFQQDLDLSLGGVKQDLTGGHISASDCGCSLYWQYLQWKVSLLLTG